jgi:maltose-binding protein MalE
VNKKYAMLVLLVIGIGVLVPGSAQPPATSAQENGLLIWVREDHPINFDAISGTFERDYNLPIKVETKPWPDIRDQFADAARSGSGPDIFTASDDWLWRYIPDGLIEPVDLGPKTTDYIPFAIQALSHDGRLYGVPYLLENLAFVRNAELVPDVPKTWAEVMEISGSIRERGAADYGFVMQDYDWYDFYPIQTAFGGYVFGRRPDGTFDVHDIGLNNDGSIAALQWLQQMVQGGLMPNELDYETAFNMFGAGKAAMIIVGPWEIGRLDQSGVPYGVSGFPVAALPGSPWVHVQAFIVNAHSHHKEAALDLLTQYIATEQNMRIISADSRRLSASTTVFEQTDDPVLRGFIEALMNGQQFPYGPELDIVWGPYVDAIQRVREGAEPQAAVKEAVASIRQQIGQ